MSACLAIIAQPIRIFTAALLSALMAHAAFADGASELIDQIPANAQILQQTGTANQATIEQSLVGAGLVPGISNNAAVVQSGIDNQSLVQQSGTNLDAAITQNGTANNATIGQSDTNHAAVITQNGEGLGAKIEQSGAGDGVPITINQTGTGYGQPITVRRY